MAKGWGGRRLRPLINFVVRRDAGICWLCGEPGADSADHDPPRSDLIAAGVPNPDDPEYLRAAHLLCNKRRGKRPVTESLRVELRAKRAVDVARAAASASLSPIFAARRPSFESRRRAGRTGSPLPSPGTAGKIDESERP